MFLEAEKSDGKGRFTVRHTNIVKGAVILFLLFHHLFYAKIRYDLMDIRFWDSDGIPVIQPFAYMCGLVCVYIFLILSGFGNYRKLQKTAPEGAPPGSVCRVTGLSLLKTMKSYWFAVVVFAAASALAGIWYTGNKLGAFLLDLGGLSYVFGTYSMNDAWWYMSALLFSYLLAPVFYFLTVRVPRISFAACVLAAAARYLIPSYTGVPLLLYHTDLFWLGMLLARFEVLDRCVALAARVKAWMYLTPALLLTVLLGFLRLVTDDTRFSVLLAVSAIALFAALGRWEKLGGALAFLGVHSGNMYFMHSFFYSDSCRNLLYRWRNPVVVYLLLIAASLLLSMAFEGIKKYRDDVRPRRLAVQACGMLACALCLFGLTRISAQLRTVYPVYLYYRTGTDETFQVSGVRAFAAEDGTVELTWTKNRRADGYLIYRKLPDEERLYLGEAVECEFVDKRPSAGEYNYYWVFPYEHANGTKGYADRYVYAMPQEEQHEHVFEETDADHEGDRGTVDLDES